MADRPFVTDHTVLRYLERSCGVPVEDIREAIAKGCARGAKSGAPCVRFRGARFLVRNGKVVTALGGRTVPYFRALQRLLGKEADDG